MRAKEFPGLLFLGHGWAAGLPLPGRQLGMERPGAWGRAILWAQSLPCFPSPSPQSASWSLPVPSLPFHNPLLLSLGLWGSGRGLSGGPETVLSSLADGSDDCTWDPTTHTSWSPRVPCGSLKEEDWGPG